MQDNSDNLSDEELAVMARTQSFAFGVLMERYEAKLMRYIMRKSNVTKEGAEDLLQESFIKAYEKINSFDADLAFSSWMYRIVHNTTVSGWRRSSVRPEGHVAQVDDEFLARIMSEEDITGELHTEDLVQAMTQVFAQMKDDYREVLVLKFMEDKSYQEISDILKKSMGTVATLINRAKKQFLKIHNEQTLET